MKPIDWVIIGVLVLAMTGIIVYLVRQKKNGKSGCGCGCQNCPSKGKCHGTTEEENV